MLKRDDFVNFILEGPKEKKAKKAAGDQGPSLPDGFDDFGFSSEETQKETESEFSFARQLMEASGFGNAEYLERSEVILGNDPAAKHLPERVYYWPKKDKRPYQTLLFELEQPGRQLLKASLFKKLKSQEILEDAVSRLVQMSLRGFEKGGEKRTASVKSGKQNETLCIVSIRDDRLESDKPLHLVCLGTKSKKLNSLENYHIREEARLWERQLAVDHLSRLYDRHFSKLDGEKWQESFITGEERKLAQKLMDACIKKQPQKRSIEKCVVGLLEEIAKTFGLRKKKGGRRLIPFELPKDHDIGVDPEKREKGGGQNPFEGMILRDEKSRLLGYIIYCLDQKKDAGKLRKYLERNNRFHNVLVIYPDGTEAVLELWQGMKRLEGKLTKQGAAFEGEGKIVNLLSRFFVVSKAKVRNPEELAQELAYRARYLRRLALKQLQEEKKSGLLRDLYNTFKEALIHDQTEDQFADSYAQTLTYGLLSARWISKDEFASKGERFTRKKALEHFPPSSPFLRDFFKAVLKAHSEFKLSWLLDDIADLLDRTDIGSIFEPGIGDSGDLTTDPVIHFYEPFLAAYDAKLKKKRGVYYTPQPVVSFIVRSVDEILRTDFGLKDGLADTTTWGEMIKRHKGLKLPKNAKLTDFFVQILDIASGTGTFMVEVIHLIHKTMTEKWERKKQTPSNSNRLWNNYVSENLLPRLYGFELIMAPYAIAHMKIGLKLQETGCKSVGRDRVNIYLTNTLEPKQDFSGRFSFAVPALSGEANAVNLVKNNIPFTVLIGNPPYFGEAGRGGKWISSLMRGEDTQTGKITHNYFKVEGEGLKERNSKWLNDDYVKFIRTSQYYLERTGVGLHGFITNNGYLDNPTFRGMRESLLDSFAKLSIVDLHGSTKKKEISPDGSKDENVFDIMAGVGIGIFIKPLTTEDSTQVKHMDCFGLRNSKYRWLSENTLSSCDWNFVTPSSPFYLFVPSDNSLIPEYERFWSIDEIMPVKVLGFQTHRDNFAIDLHGEALKGRISEMKENNIPDEDYAKKYGLRDNRDWQLSIARRELRNMDRTWKKPITQCLYRPFDKRVCYFSKVAMDYPRRELVEHVYGRENICLLVSRQTGTIGWRHAFVSDCVAESCVVSLKSREGNYDIPLYIFQKKFMKEETDKVPNINKLFIKELEMYLKLKWTTAKERSKCDEKFSANDLLHYFYAVLYSPEYRRKYGNALRMAFPRIPLISEKKLFETLCRLGEELVSLHLMNWGKLSNVGKRAESLFAFPVVGNNRLGKNIRWEKNSKDSDDLGRIFINKTQYFDNVSKIIWDFQIGGYQVCHKWLKDRAPKGGKNPQPGQILNDLDIQHYRKILASINETIRLMNEIDGAIKHHGGWPAAFITKNGDK